MGSVVVASLGKTPGAITTLVDALIENGEKIERVIPVYIKNLKVFGKRGEPVEIDELEEEFGTYEPYKTIILDYKDKYLDGKDIGEIEGYVSLDTFYEKVWKIICDLRAQNKDIIVGIGGGRKGMSSMMTYAALAENIEKIYQVIVSEEIEKFATPDKWEFDQERRQRALHPKKNEEYWLVKLPSLGEIRNIHDISISGMTVSDQSIPVRNRPYMKKCEI